MVQGSGTERGEGTVVVVVGLVTAFGAATSAFAQFERGANRIYGVRRDRPGAAEVRSGGAAGEHRRVLMAAGLLVGGLLTVVSWLGVSGLLALYMVVARGFDDTYGPLTAIVVLLLWANVTGIALLSGIAVAAQVEAVRGGRPDPLLADSDDDGVPDGVPDGQASIEPADPSALSP